MTSEATAWPAPGEQHPVTRVLARLDTAVGEALEVPLLGLDEPRAAEALAAVTAVESRLVALRARLTSQAEAVGVGTGTGTRDAGAWLAHRSRLSSAEARRRSRFAQRLVRWQAVAAALAEGDVNAEQAQAITTALDDLPDSLDPALLDRAEAHLLTEARDFGPRELRVIGERLLHVVSPETADAHDARVLSAQERDAWERADLWMNDDGHGATWGRFRIPTASAAVLRTALHALAAPARRPDPERPADPGPPGRSRPYRFRMGQAFCELLDRIPVDALPDTGGANATIVVSMTLDQLRAEPRERAGDHGAGAVASLDTGDRLSVADARRRACEAGLVPAVLGGAGQVLDLGRRRRLFTRSQRLVLQRRDRECTADGCDAPAGFCHAHHDEPWSRGGPTDLANARLLCGHHHRRIHDPAYRAEITPDNQVRFHRRT
ncbi:HNH endonuclease signature motif containing protein [Nocardioides bruguierae]|uniref:HNH endonuclease n=1 Tax=Nocardioides bruguierae TaxID=2945102 RepID=A0A9X2D8K7_9ACTN|nr:HNH endonuclease signature motif containing protein [Nocardioides bruguierae]MCM0621049.1 HNH endonuclease [Nocardioides bruguierae]